MKKDYKSKLSIIKTQEATNKIKQYFTKELQTRLSLTKVSAPLFVSSDTGFQDMLSGIEKAISFEVEERLEIVQSLAKWKRYALMKYKFNEGTGIITDMLAIRKDEKLDEIHSYLVDQWDWERVINKNDRTKETLINTITSIYKTIRSTNKYIKKEYPVLTYKLPKTLYIITSQELEDLYPKVSPNDREILITKEKRAVFIIGIGNKLKSGISHDKRSPDYDDWSLDGDLLLWSDILERPVEITSMGIRVDEKTLKIQLEKAGCTDRLSHEYHQLIMTKKMPYTIGGGIGQSRLCMLFLEKTHIGEVQASYWNKDTIQKCDEIGVELL